MPAKSDKHLLEAGWIPEWRRVFQESLDSGNDFGFQPFEPSHPHSRDDYLLLCPCCQTRVQALEQKSLIELQKRLWVATEVLAVMYQNRQRFYYGHPRDLYMQAIRRFEPQYPQLYGDLPVFLIWACDGCISNAKAEIADFEKAFCINHGEGRAAYFYFDYSILCMTCQKPFIYSRGEQRWAFETFVLNSDSTLKKCQECRRKKNKQHWIDHTIVAQARAEPTFENLYKASQVLLENTDTRALEYLRRAKNKAPSLEQKALLEQQILDVKT